MRVLLIGKFPPGQGGISAKTYWLARALATKGICYDVVTLLPDNYQSVSTGPLPKNARLRIVRPSEPPWFIPGTDTITEQLLTASLDLAKVRPPDIVEANYLVPFGLVAAAAARILQVPLLLRHAGSDLAKLGTWEATGAAIRGLLQTADLVVSPKEGIAAEVSHLLDQAPVAHLPRYVPDPTEFTHQPSTPASTTILLAGKLNYHWRLKALDCLFAAMSARPEWHLKALVGGTGDAKVRAEADRHGVSDRISWDGFVPPAEMPSWIARTSAVWSVERPGGVVDFSNLVPEALAMGRPCLVSKTTVTKQSAQAYRTHPGLLTVEPDNQTSVLQKLDAATALAHVPPLAELSSKHTAYVEGNLAQYQALADRRAATSRSRC
jgi:glycosyltransferase involved in cell wall biosynthesis